MSPATRCIVIWETAISVPHSKVWAILLRGFLFFSSWKKKTVIKTKDNFFSKRILILYYRERVQHLRIQSHRRGLMNIRGNRRRADDKASTCTEAHTPTRFSNCFDLLNTFSGYSTFLPQKTKIYFLTSFRLKQRQSLHETMDMI